ncbi:MFS transporter [Leptolyngbya sp. PCC 6406]|uniref:MFS transporter n=1 Tax=Leptolyngbya sp. PCC 6406 TaxID=1173264 RepID=UPI0002AC3251|nr:MFS transporter [Leptolyngbya sp. PCC 6406]
MTFNSPAANPAQNPNKLTLPTKLAYGLGDVGAGMTSNLIAFFSLFFLVEVAGLTQGAAAVVSLIGRVWDGVNDPMVGAMSDRTQTRWGRRYPWMVITTIPFGLSFVMMWLVPDFTNSTLRLFYFIAAYVLFQTFFTTTNLPYTTLTAELTQDYDDRTELTAFRLAFSVAGAVLVLILGLIFTQQFPDQPRFAYGLLASICGVVAIATLLICVFGTYKRAQEQSALLRSQGRSLQEGTRMSLTQQLKVVFSTRPFLYVVGIYLCSWMALQITAAIIPFFVISWMQLPQTSAYIAALLVQGTAIPLMFVCNVISRRMGKRGLYFIGTGSWLVVQTGLFFLQPGQTGLMYGLCVAASFGVATTYVVPWSILPDVIELDEANTGERREGLFYAFMTLLQKFGLGVGVALVGLALEVTGYEASAALQPASALLALRIAIGPLPMVLLAIGLVLAYFYPITREIHAETLLRLVERHRE